MMIRIHWRMRRNQTTPGASDLVIWCEQKRVPGHLGAVLDRARRFLTTLPLPL